MNAEHVGGLVLASACELHRDSHQRPFKLRHDQVVHIGGLVALQPASVRPQAFENERFQRIGLLIARRSSRWWRRPRLPVEAFIERIPHRRICMPAIRRAVNFVGGTQRSRGARFD